MQCRHAKLMSFSFLVFVIEFPWVASGQFMWLCFV
jgi:hypothetical protein